MIQDYEITVTDLRGEVSRFIATGVDSDAIKNISEKFIISLNAVDGGVHLFNAGQWSKISFIPIKS